MSKPNVIYAILKPQCSSGYTKIYHRLIHITELELNDEIYKPVNKYEYKKGQLKEINPKKGSVIRNRDKYSLKINNSANIESTNGSEHFFDDINLAICIKIQMLKDLNKEYQKEVIVYQQKIKDNNEICDGDYFDLIDKFPEHFV
jgi:hypothetical protein